MNVVPTHKLTEQYWFEPLQMHLPAMRRQTMHMENATSMMMGSWERKNGGLVKGLVTISAAGDNRKQW